MTSRVELKDEEVWKDVKGFEGFYQVSNTGEVKSLDRKDSSGRNIKGKKLKPWKRGKDYNLCDLYMKGNRFVKSVHVLVYETFSGEERNKGEVIHHIDSNKVNNNYYNLEKLTSTEHNKHHCNGRIPWNKGIKYGESEAFAKSIETKKLEYIKRCIETNNLVKSGLSIRSVSKTLGITPRSVYDRLKKNREMEKSDYAKDR